MLFKVVGDDLDNIKNTIAEFCALAEVEWKRQIPEASKKLRDLKFPMPVKIPDASELLPEEMKFVHWVDGDCVFMRIPVAIPFGRVFKMPKKKAQKNLEGFLKDKGVDAKVKYMGD
jgi:hypothetical protein